MATVAGDGSNEKAPTRNPPQTGMPTRTSIFSDRAGSMARASPPTRRAATDEFPDLDRESGGERGFHPSSDPDDHVRADAGHVPGRPRPDDRIHGAADDRRGFPPQQPAVLGDRRVPAG